MARIEISAKRRVIDHSYSIPQRRLDQIKWYDPDTGEYGWDDYDTTKNIKVEKTDHNNWLEVKMNCTLAVATSPNAGVLVPALLSTFTDPDVFQVIKELRKTINLVNEFGEVLTISAEANIEKCQECGAKRAIDYEHCDRWNCPALRS